MDKQEFYYESSDGIHQIHAIKWIPDGKVKGILQIMHGMCEFVDRYDRFAFFLANAGYLVCGNDHLGHGQSINTEADLGFFHQPNGKEYLIKDVDHLRSMMQDEYPDVPYFMLGHSMGSFLIRYYMIHHSDGLSGAIVMGTGEAPNSAVHFLMATCSTIAKVRGWHTRSRFVAELSMGSYNNAFKPNRTPYDWLTRNQTIVDQYASNPLDTFTMTVNGFYTMGDLILSIQKQKNIDCIPKELPILIISGAKDPVGDFGKGPLAVYISYKNAGIKDVLFKLYHDARHEILNEIDHDMTDQDILYWLEKRSHH